MSSVCASEWVNIPMKVALKWRTTSEGVKNQSKWPAIKMDNRWSSIYRKERETSGIRRTRKRESFEMDLRRRESPQDLIQPSENVKDHLKLDTRREGGMMDNSTGVTITTQRRWRSNRRQSRNKGSIRLGINNSAWATLFALAVLLQTTGKLDRVGVLFAIRQVIAVVVLFDRSTSTSSSLIGLKRIYRSLIWMAACSNKLGYWLYSKHGLVLVLALWMDGH